MSPTSGALLLSTLSTTDGQHPPGAQRHEDPGGQSQDAPRPFRRASWQGQSQPCGPLASVVITPTGQASRLLQDGAPVHGPKNDFAGGCHVRWPSSGHFHSGSGGYAGRGSIRALTPAAAHGSRTALQTAEPAARCTRHSGR